MSGIGTRRRGIGKQVSTAGQWKQRLASMVYGMLLGVVIPTLALGQASLLPDAKQQYLDDAGNPIAGGSVTYYVPGQSTKKNVWLDAAQTTLSTNPVVLDAAGRPQPTGQTYGSGIYRQKVVDANNVVVWDAVTASTGSGGGGTNIPATGDGNLVGTVLAFPGWSLPNQYMYADGHAVSRTTYPELLTALTQVANALCTAGLPTLTGLPFSTTFRVPIGASVEASCIAPGSTVVSKATNSLTMSSNASISTAVSARIFFYGNGDRSTTFNLPDLRSSVPAGMDTMDSAVAARGVLIPPYFPQNGLGAATISPSTILSLANLPPYTPAGTITNGVITNTVTGGVNGGTGVNTTVAAAGVQLLTGSTPIAVSSAQATSTFAGTPVGSSTPFSVVQPTIMTNYIIKVTPDANSAQATGVLSLGGMTGALACGTGILCTGNTVSLNGTPVFSPGSATVGNIAFWLDTNATTLGASPGFITANPGNAAIYSSLANPVNGYTGLYNGMVFQQGATIPTSAQFGGGTINVQQSVVGTLNIASGDTGIYQGNALAGYCNTNQPTGAGLSVAGCVGIMGQSGTTVANASIFGLSGIAQNITGPSIIGFDVGYMGGAELNPNLWQKSGSINPTVSSNHFYGLNIQGGGNHTNEIGSALVINNSAFPATTRWATGIELIAGCCVTGVTAGPVALGNSQRSQYISAAGIDGGGTVRSALFYADSGGNAVLSPFLGTTGIIFLDNGSGTPLLSASSAFGSSKIRVPAFTTAGVVTNDVTTGQLNSVTTLISGLTAPALVVTGSFTATGLVTNADLTNPSTTVNGQTCTLGSTCTVAASATSITAGTTTVTGGPGVLSNASSGGVLVSSLTLPSGATAPALTVTGSFTATGLVTNADLVSASTTVNGTACTLGSSCTVTAAGNTLTGTTVGSASSTTLASTVLASSLTSLGTITSLTATTVNAFTQGGNISGGGFQHNNVIIGASTPLAGTFTTLTANTSVSSPTHTASGALTFQSNGSTFAGDVTTGQQWYLGSTLNAPASGVQLTVSKNAAAPAPAPLAGTIADFVQVDGTAARLAIRQFGAGAAGPAVVYYAAGGTAASPTQTLSGTPIGVNFGFGYGSGAYQVGAGSGFQMNALENCVSTSCGSDFEIITTPIGAGAQSTVAYFKQGLSVGSSTDPGAGKINAQLGFVAGGTAGVTKTCTIAVGNVLTFTLGILTATSGVAGCV